MFYSRRVLIKEMPGQLSKGLYIYSELPDGKIEQTYQDAEKGTATTKVFEMSEAVPPILQLSPEELQDLADELQRLNIRPREAGKTEGLYEAQTLHLADMRRIAFGGPDNMHVGVDLAAHGSSDRSVLG